MTKSWIILLIEWLSGGIIINNNLHKLVPVLHKTGNSYRKGVCPECKSKNGFVFRSTTQESVVVLFCKDCKKITVNEGEVKEKPTPHHAQCHCGQALPPDRKVWCYDCRPRTKKPKVVENQDGSASIHGEVTGYGM